MIKKNLPIQKKIKNIKSHKFNCQNKYCYNIICFMNPDKCVYKFNNITHKRLHDKEQIEKRKSYYVLIDIYDKIKKNKFYTRNQIKNLIDNSNLLINLKVLEKYHFFEYYKNYYKKEIIEKDYNNKKYDKRSNTITSLINILNNRNKWGKKCNNLLNKLNSTIKDISQYCKLFKTNNLPEKEYSSNKLIKNKNIKDTKTIKNNSSYNCNETNVWNDNLKSTNKLLNENTVQKNENKFKLNNGNLNSEKYNINYLPPQIFNVNHLNDNLNNLLLDDTYNKYIKSDLKTQDNFINYSEINNNFKSNSFTNNFNNVNTLNNSSLLNNSNNSNLLFNNHMSNFNNNLSSNNISFNSNQNNLKYQPQNNLDNYMNYSYSSNIINRIEYIESYYNVYNLNNNFFERINHLDQIIGFNSNKFIVIQRLEFHENIINCVLDIEIKLEIPTNNYILIKKLNNIELMLYNEVNNFSIYERIQSIKY